MISRTEIAFFNAMASKGSKAKALTTPLKIYGTPEINHLPILNKEPRTSEIQSEEIFKQAHELFTKALEINLQMALKTGGCTLGYGADLSHHFIMVFAELLKGKNNNKLSLNEFNFEEYAEANITNIPAIREKLNKILKEQDDYKDLSYINNSF